VLRTTSVVYSLVSVRGQEAVTLKQARDIPGPTWLLTQS